MQYAIGCFPTWICCCRRQGGSLNGSYIERRYEAIIQKGTIICFFRLSTTKSTVQFSAEVVHCRMRARIAPSNVPNHQIYHCNNRSIARTFRFFYDKITEHRFTAGWFERRQVRADTATQTDKQAGTHAGRQAQVSQHTVKHFFSNLLYM